MSKLHWSVPCGLLLLYWTLLFFFNPTKNIPIVGFPFYWPLWCFRHEKVWDGHMRNTVFSKFSLPKMFLVNTLSCFLWSYLSSFPKTGRTFKIVFNPLSPLRKREAKKETRLNTTLLPKFQCLSIFSLSNHTIF